TTIALTGRAKENRRCAPETAFPPPSFGGGCRRGTVRKRCSACALAGPLGGRGLVRLPAPRPEPFQFANDPANLDRVGSPLIVHLVWITDDGSSLRIRDRLLPNSDRAGGSCSLLWH